MSVDVATHPARGVGLVPRRLLGDERLARLASAGDTAAFEAIFERYHQELYRYCRAILANHEEAQDALQSTMAAALRALPGERREIALRPWLYRVAHNEAITIARRRADAALVHDSFDGLSAHGADLETAQRERLRELVADLRALPERQRGALVMRELSDLGYAEIGAAISTSEAAARQLVYEAREALRESKRGREMDCLSVREAISERDGRRLRGRALRAHLRNCDGCEDFRAAISIRSGDLQALAPAMPAVAAAGVLGTLLGGAGKGGFGAAGVGAAALGKGSAMVAAVVVGAGALGATGAIDLPDSLTFANDDPPAASSAGQAGAAHAGDGSQGAAASAVGAANGERGRGEEHRADGQGSSGTGSENAKPGENGQAGEQGSGSPALGTGTEHALPEPAGGDDPPGAAVGNPFISESQTGTRQARPEAGGASSDAVIPEPPEQSAPADASADPNG